MRACVLGCQLLATLWFAVHGFEVNVPLWALEKRQDAESMQLDKTAELGPTTAQEKEDVYAWENFFYKQTHGVMLEMGALDGKYLSISLNFEQSLNWNIVLIEASPTNYASLKKNRPDQITVNAAVCSKPQEVHFIESNVVGGSVGGILEFMGHKVGDFHGDLAGKLADESTKQAALDSLPVVQCLPLSPLLNHLHIRHINFFSLDVEGAEFEVLKSIDFKKIKFDVLAIEQLSAGTTVKEHQDDLETQLLEKVGYKKHGVVGFNAWYVREGFQPSKKPA